MKPVPFTHEIPKSLQLADKALTGDNSKVMAGGQSIGPMLNLRLVRPTTIVSIDQLDELQTVHIKGDVLSIGAAVTHAQIEDGIDDVDLPTMLRHVARSIAYRAVRNKGTIGGSLAHADPAADWVSAMTALGAQLVIRNAHGKSRREPMAGFMRGAYRTALQQGDIIVAVELPTAMGKALWGYEKICRKVGEFADAIGAVVIQPDLKYARIVVGATEDAPLLLDDMAREMARTATAPSLDEIDGALAAHLPGASRVKRQLLKTALSRAIAKVIPS
ncbi:CoxL/CutL-like molybdenum hydroxylase family protein large subunit [Octadecabacter arcticus 238]|jgi:carbon-monoxide dehydrogenase medium subunit|uniref:CoxL/CutL-like molybdenum hydroxylase family protein large subunit n=1 Tax=Octadecabacter arcticus 238 TaxID=391616 RepID=M9RH11_9RHOB|nr:FAD binding domain-containing protein [Octadecabacter arcticus]AGI71038.1 CoxL/CutL-like molybdenum hydroxylase family protein large subunit [Octadecabacter arcticus 238]